MNIEAENIEALAAEWRKGRYAWRWEYPAFRGQLVRINRKWERALKQARRSGKAKWWKTADKMRDKVWLLCFAPKGLARFGRL